MNNQKISKVLRGNGDMLEVHSVFKTIQGEGVFSGVPAVFLRLSGCNLQCPRCDTEYSSYTLESIENLVSEINTFNVVSKLVVITGGEPFRQNISVLCNKLLEEGFTVQVETNGTLAPQGIIDERVVVVCSPKTDRVNSKVPVNFFKYVISDGSVDEDGIPIQALGNKVKNSLYKPPVGSRVFIQPEDSKNVAKNTANLQACVESSITFGHTLQVQLHKIIGVE